MTSNELDASTHRTELEDILLNRPLASLYDICYLYGRLHTTHLVHAFDDVPIDEEYLRQRLTPEARPEYFDRAIGMVSVPIDLSGDDPQIVSAAAVDRGASVHDSADNSPLIAEPVDRETLLRVGLSRQDSRASGHNMSLAHDVSGKSPTKCAGYVENIFTRWIDSHIAAEVAADHPDGWIVDALRELATDEQTLSMLQTDLETTLNELVEEFTGVVSLRIRVDPNGPFHYPGELSVLNEVTHRRWIQKQMGSYSEATDSSGIGTDFVTGEKGKVFGLSDSPLRRYQGKMADGFPALSPDASWQTRPLTSDTAFAVVAGARIIEEFVQLTRDDTQLYLIPYLPRPSVKQSVALYTLAREAMDNDGQVATLLSDELTDPASPLYDPELYIYYAMAYEPERKRKVLVEEPIVSAESIRTIAEAHNEILRSDVLEAPPGRQPLFPAPAYSRLESTTGSDDEGYSGSDYLTAVESDAVFEGLLHGGYFRSTFYDRRADADTDDYGATDPQVIAVRRCLAPDSGLDTQWLLQQYVPRLEQRQRERFGETSPAEAEDPNAALPESLLTRQYVQFQALAHAGRLKTTTDTDPLVEPVDLSATSAPTSSMTEAATDDATDREQRLKQFIEAHPALRDDIERRGAFLLGAFVGCVAAFQKDEDISRTVIRQHPIDGLTLSRFATTLSQVMDKNAVYSGQSDKPGLLMNSRYTTRLNDIVSTRPPGDWTLRTEDLRMHYALGLSYGVNDS